jgi:predicted Zn-dependent peptidase
MEYQKIKQNNYNLHIIKTDRFKTIKVKINFERECKKEEITIRNFLCDILARNSKKYNSERLISIKLEDLYSFCFSSKTQISGNYNILSYDFTFLNEKYTESGMNEESLEFINEILFNPNVTDGKFDLENFNIVKSSLKDLLNAEKENPDRYAVKRLFETMDIDILSYDGEGYIEDLDKIDVKNLYDYYLKVISEDNVDIFVVGDVDDKFISQIKDIFKFDDREIFTKSHYLNPIDVRKEILDVTEMSNYKQSKLLLGFKVNEMSEFERNYVTVVYNYILGGSADSKLFKKVREENSLCYTINSNFNRLSYTMYIKAGLDLKAKDKAVSLIKEELKNIEEGNFSDDDIAKAVIAYKNSLIQILDSPSSIVGLYENHEYLKTDLRDERMTKIEKVTKDDVINLAKKIKLDTIFLLGGTNESN